MKSTLLHSAFFVGVGIILLFISYIFYKNKNTKKQKNLVLVHYSGSVGFLILALIPLLLFLILDFKELFIFNHGFKFSW